LPPKTESLVVREGTPVTVITYRCVYLPFVSSDHDERTSGSFGCWERLVVKFITNENSKPSEIMTRLRAQFGYETLSSTPVYDWSKSLKEG
jgi:hypothetical protein